MKISIWHQFSSNHSASFTVVGQFDTVERAKEVETEMIEFLKEVAIHRNNDRYPTWIELEYARKHNIEWETGIDWVRKPIEENLVRFENYIFLAGSDTYVYPDPVEKLMQVFADNVFMKSYDAGREPTLILISLHCQTPKTEVIRPIMQEIGAFLDECKSGESDVIIPPWDSYSHKSKYFANPAGVLGGEINQKGLNINLEIAFFDTQYGLPTLVAYLKDKGCTDIEYSLSAIPYSSRQKYW